MTQLTRWGFLKKTSAGALALGALGALGALPSAARAAGRLKTPAAPAPEMAAVDPFVVYVRDPAAGEMVLLAGSTEITHTDPDLVARLWQARAGAHAASKHAVQAVVR